MTTFSPEQLKKESRFRIHFYQKRILEFIHWSEYKTRQCLNQLHEMEYLEKLTGRHGKVSLSINH